MFQLENNSVNASFSRHTAILEKCIICCSWPILVNLLKKNLLCVFKILP